MAPAATVQLDLANGTSPSGQDLPPIAALFLVLFDIKTGYKIEWQKTVSGVDLEGVEFKSLPSGLHNLKEDLVYFVHDRYAGVSAFVNVHSTEENRNALMLSVGVLVPLSYGRLGRSWRHAQNLKDLAKNLTNNIKDIKQIEEYYDTHQVEEDTESATESPLNSPTSNRKQPASRYKAAYNRYPSSRHRSISDATAIIGQGQTLSPFHPALSLPEFVTTFGPLIFPLYRVALTRKRILLITEAPVEKACNFVYDISILSNIPLAVADLLSVDPVRLRPLFNIGVHDIPVLEEEAQRIKASSDPLITNELGNWVATSTDGVLYIKKDLYDVIIRMPPAHVKFAKDHVWPTIEYSETGEQMKATQRDLNRYRALKKSLRKYMYLSEEDEEAVTDDPSDQESGNGSADASRRQKRVDRRASTMTSRSIREYREADDASSAMEESVCEKMTWPQMAYSGFLWWASAGEKRNDTTEEDSEGLEAQANDDDDDDENVPLVSQQQQQQPKLLGQQGRRATSLSLAGLDSNGALGNAEMDIIAYFHRMTTRIIGQIADLVDPDDDDDEEGDKEEVYVSADDMILLGLDRFSEGDERFLKEVMRKYFGKTAVIEKGGLSMCGVRFC